MIGAPTIVSPSRRSLNSPPRYILRDPQTSLTSRPVSLLPNGTYISLMEGLSISSPARKSCSSSSFSSAAPYLPTELIHHIFAYLASPDLSMKCRPLNTRFSAIAERILTRRFRMKLSGLETQFKTASEQCDLVQRTLGPHLTHYRQFLRGVDVGDIKEAAWYSNPPAELHTVCVCLSLLYLQGPDYSLLTHSYDPSTTPATSLMSWTECKRLLTRIDFKNWASALGSSSSSTTNNNITNTVDSIPLTNIRLVERIIQHDSHITYERLREVSTAGYKLLIIVAACLQYGSINEEVKVELKRRGEIETVLKGTRTFLEFLEKPMKLDGLDSKGSSSSLEQNVKSKGKMVKGKSAVVVGRTAGVGGKNSAETLSSSSSSSITSNNASIRISTRSRSSSSSSSSTLNSSSSSRSSITSSSSSRTSLVSTSSTIASSSSRSRSASVVSINNDAFRPRRSSRMI